MNVARSVDAILAGRRVQRLTPRATSACNRQPPHAHACVCLPAHLPHPSALRHRREPVTQLRWVDASGRMMVRLEGEPEGRVASSAGGGMHAAVAEVGGRLGRSSGRWFQGLLELAAQPTS